MTTAGALESVLDAVLLPQGFTRARRATSWRREAGAVEHIVGLRRGHGGAPGAAIFVAEVAPGSALDRRFELSPVAPLSNTFWWPALLAASEMHELHAQIEQVALPFFTAAGFEPATTEQAVHAALAGVLASAQRAVHGFARSPDGTWWRERGQVIDLVIPEFLALSRFVRPWVAVWHRDLAQGLSGTVPDGVTHAAAHTLGLDGVDGEPLSALVAARAPAEWFDVWAQRMPAALQWFDGIQSAADVLAQVRDEYKSAMRDAG